MKFDVISFYDVIYLTEPQWSIRAFKLLKTEPFSQNLLSFMHSLWNPLTMVGLRENKR